MNIGFTTSSISRSAGGLFWSVRSLARELQSNCGNVHIFAGEDVFSKQDVQCWGDISVTLLPVRGPKIFGYQASLLGALKASSCDIIHSHGLWMYSSIATWMVCRKVIPYVISPRGMLDSWALNNSRWKKRLAALLYEKKNLRNASCLHALCEAEYEAIRAYGLTNPVAIIPNGVDLPDVQIASAEPNLAFELPGHKRILLFLGRLHPKKGLENLLHAWSKVQTEQAKESGQWILVIAGWEQGGYQARLQQLVSELALDDTVRFVGSQFGKDKEACFRRADAFILPSFSEGLPMAVLEAWSYGLPVLMTPQCNLPLGFACQAAIAMDPTPTGIGAGLTRLFSIGERELEQMGHNGFSLVAEEFSWGKVAQRMCAVYRWLLGLGQMPADIRLG